jgi:hypothetical protein
LSKKKELALALGSNTHGVIDGYHAPEPPPVTTAILPADGKSPTTMTVVSLILAAVAE